MENFRLKVFRAVALHLNFRIAAETLLLTQPAVSQQIKALEAELGVALFDRTAGKISLTTAGKTLLPYAEKLASLAAEAHEAVAATMGTNAGHLSIAASQTISQYILPRLLAGFLFENPKVEISILSGNTQAAVDTLLDHRAQIALIEGPAMRQDVRVEPFMRDRMICVVPATHEWSGKHIDLAQLKTATLLTRELGSGSRRIVEQAIEQASLSLRDLHIRMTFDSTEGLLSAVEAGLGIAFVSRWTARAQLALGALQVVEIRGLKLDRMFSLVTPGGPVPTGTAGAFHRFVLEHARAIFTPRPSR